MASNSDAAELSVPDLTPAPKVLLVVAPYYRAIADAQISGATAVLDQCGSAHELIEVPGALEVPTAIRLAQNHYEGFIALGCVIRGETTHYDTVCNDSSRALSLLGLDGLCIGNGILTCENMAQAVARAEPDQMNKGGGAAEAALHLIALKRRFARPDRPERKSPDGGDFLLADTTGLTRTA